MQTPVQWGALPDGRAVRALRLRNARGTEVEVITYGAIIVSIKLPNHDGSHTDVVLGHDSIDGYMSNPAYFGAVVGRYANRIAGGSFELDGSTYSLTRNNGRNTLHGGTVGFDKALWSIEHFDDRSVRLAHVSESGNQGFPGDVRVLVTYTINDKNELEVEYEAVTSAPTVINLTQHTYWNLGGVGSGNILDHELILNASRFTPVDRELIPTGASESVVGTPFDFRTSRRIGDRIDEPNEQLEFGEGYDHNFILDPLTTDQPAALLRDPVSGRILEIRTTEPGVQLYTGNQLDGSVVGKYGIPYDRHAGICLETQHFPDSPNRARFPSTVLRPGDRFFSRTVFSFRQEG